MFTPGHAGLPFEVCAHDRLRSRIRASHVLVHGADEPVFVGNSIAGYAVRNWRGRGSTLRLGAYLAYISVPKPSWS
ncbi:hypothetical protein Strvi_4809 [Streptomyces violaceusniger Tu 4113]|uniref:Uncharacterized protein n=1 Tax=Streptomyces violaceusniger (strain Tu 4113) TaxID=653045 RepID=G2P3N5_STRV4|nr:hypothetical protein Strvi_4809 [Streptomyces violaceusniger Tu 4113]